MTSTSVQSHYTGLSRLKLFFALSRTPHGLLDMATPALSALLWLGGFPALKVIALGLVTAFSGYTAVYALNDIIDYRTDKEKIQRGGLNDSDNDLDSIIMRHPMAQDMMSYKEGLLWTLGWALLALIGAYVLNPISSLIFLAGSGLAVVYCLLLRVSYLRTFISGAVKTSGGLAAVFAVDPNPSPLFLIVLFSWLFFWEVGGQNILNDSTDIEEDRRLHAKTVPLRFGLEKARMMIIFFLVITVFLSGFIFKFAPVGFDLQYIVAGILVGFYLLLIPAYRLYKGKKRQHAWTLFKRASYYPLALLILVTVRLKT
jgi:4-hydroxybenzoate polyprenyltransferase